MNILNTTLTADGETPSFWMTGHCLMVVRGSLGGGSLNLQTYDPTVGDYFAVIETLDGSNTSSVASLSAVDKFFSIYLPEPPAVYGRNKFYNSRLYRFVLTGATSPSITSIDVIGNVEPQVRDGTYPLEYTGGDTTFIMGGIINNV